jgi:hypothetical protein
MAERDPRVDSLKGEPEMSDIKQSCAGDAAPWVMAYECRPAVNALVVALRPFLGDREFIVFRDAFAGNGTTAISTTWRVAAT